MLALISGRGALPVELMRAARPDVLVAAIETEDWHPDLDVDLTFRLETLGTLIDQLKARGVTKVCFAGGLQRPEVGRAAIDDLTRPLVPRITAALQSGDDTALRIIAEIFEEAGMALQGAHEVMPSLLPPLGQLAGPALTQVQQQDIARGFEVLGALSPVDVGQGVVVRAGQVLAVEALPGTDWMLRSLVDPAIETGGALLIKAPKARQLLSMDMPAIGPETIVAAEAAGLAGIVIAHRTVMVLEQTKVLAAAGKASIGLHVVEATG